MTTTAIDTTDNNNARDAAYSTAAHIAPGDAGEAGEYEILLSTGGPAVRITGPLNQWDEPDDAFLQCQDWGTPWQPVALDHDTQLALQDFAQNFWFGA